MDDPPAGGPGQDVNVHVDRGVGRLPLAAARVRILALHVLGRERCKRAMLQFSFVSPTAISRVHRRWKGVSGATDIVTLEHQRDVPGAPVVGEIWIAPSVARANARDHGVTTRDELARLVVHGTMHALGWEHPEDARERSRMWRRQERHLASARAMGIV